ncbi:MAG: T9SS type A sorting domain-containing protein [Flavobacteriales bacterium]|nr:T9SS type A sorting domain-containing protein [Flavobacteriales bacterium]
MSFRPLLALPFLFLTLCAPAQQHDLPEGIETFINALGQEVQVATAVSYQLTPPATEWPVVDEEMSRSLKKPREVFNKRMSNEAVNPNALPLGMDPALQTAPPFRATRNPIVNFQGQNGSAQPPDPSGAAGPEHYVQAVNLSVRIYNKTGQGVAGPFTLASFWPGTGNYGDPIVMYDRHADRWFISQFQFNPNRILVAISVTNNPAGQYHAYMFSVNQFPDYPKYSIWWDGYYMTSNSNHTACVMERDLMLAGDPGARIITLSAPQLGTAGFRSVLPADADGPLPPAGTPCNFFNLEDDAWNGVPVDRIKIYSMTTNWVTPANTSVVMTQTLPTQPFSTNFGQGFNNISQPGTNQKLDAVHQIFYFRAQHMRFMTHSSLMLCHVVNLGGGHAGIRWYELRDANNGVWSIHQQGTWAPDNGSRWMASISMDEAGNIGLAYSHTDVAQVIYPGLRFTGRLAGDPLDQMTFVETVAQNGTGAQNGSNRYGDYSHMSLDPDGTTFWFTGEFLVASGQRTRIFSFNLDMFTSVEDQQSVAAPSMVAVPQNGELLVQATGLPTAHALELHLIGMDGRLIRSRAIQAPDGTWNGRENLAGLAAGIYFARIGGGDFQKVTRFLVEH